MVKPIKKLQIGKNGLTDGMIEQIKVFFKTERNIKIEILRSCCRDKKEAKEIGDKLLEALGKNFNYRLVGYVLTIKKFRKAVEK